MTSLASPAITMSTHDNLHDFDLFSEQGPYAAYLSQERLRHNADLTTPNSQSFQLDPTLESHFSNGDMASLAAYSNPSTFPNPGPGSYFDTPHFTHANARPLCKQTFLSPRHESLDAVPAQPAEQPSSTLSTASGHSVPSAASSAMGSPYANAVQVLQGTETWTEATPAIVPVDTFGSDHYGQVDLDPEIVFASDKSSNGYVGECAELSPSQHPMRANSLSSSTVHSPVRASAPPVLSRPSRSSRRSVTIDSILDEVNGQVSGARSSSVSSSANNPSMRAATRSPLRSDAVFKSPITPASARASHLPLSFASLSSPRDKRPLPASTVTGPAAKKPFSPTTRPARPPTPDVQEGNPARRRNPPLLGQNSGTFIAPLGSSCWFPWRAPSSFYAVLSLLFDGSSEDVLANMSCFQILLSSTHSTTTRPHRKSAIYLNSATYPYFRRHKYLFSNRPRPLTPMHLHGVIVPALQSSRVAASRPTSTPLRISHIIPT